MRKKLMITVGLVMVLWWWLWPRGANLGQIKSGKVKEIKSEESELLEYKSDDLFFKYPSWYRLEQIEESDKNGIRLVGKTGVLAQIIIKVRKNVSNWDEVSGVAMRKLKTDIYKEEKVDDGILFVKTDPYEITIFLLKNNRLLSISMTVNSADGSGYGDDWETVYGSIIW